LHHTLLVPSNTHTFSFHGGDLPLQGMNGLPETGVSDVGTWQALLGEAAQPADLVNLSANNAQYDDDMSGHSDSVWLLVRVVANFIYSAEMYPTAQRCCLPAAMVLSKKVCKESNAGEPDPVDCALAAGRAAVEPPSVLRAMIQCRKFRCME
jgi:hypothetical protein